MKQTGLTGKKWLRLILILPALVLTMGNARGQTTQFTYQGKLGDNGNAANGRMIFNLSSSIPRPSAPARSKAVPST